MPIAVSLIASIAAFAPTQRGTSFSHARWRSAFAENILTTESLELPSLPVHEGEGDTSFASHKNRYCARVMYDGTGFRGWQVLIVTSLLPRYEDMILTPSFFPSGPAG